MEKIININFQSRVIAIEESAYEALRQYTDSLRTYFANEESSEEIINDIENRIAELLANQLKQGASCINIANLNAVIDSIGRIEAIKAAEGEDEPQPHTTQPGSAVISDRFYRNADDKIIAGVCSGIANRLNIDAVGVRILFVIFFGALFWIYILLWIIVPSQSLSTHITRRLFRNRDDKVLAGVCSGLAVYTRTESWKVRMIFLLPLLISILFHSLHFFEWHWGFPNFFVGSFSSSFFVLYVILWIALPYASSTTDKMELRGRRIDINSIKAATQARTGSAPQPSRPVSSGLGRIIGILFKSFFLLIAGSVALGLFGALIGLVFAGMVTMPFSDFLLNGWDQYALTWTGIVLTLGIPLLALTIWLIRRMMGVRTQRHYLGYVFAVLWFSGLMCALVMACNITNNFSSRSEVEEQVPLQQPSTGILYINVNNAHSTWHSSHYGNWFNNWDDNEEDDPFHIISKDSLWLNTVKVNIEQSPDTLFHIYEVRTSRANTTQEAKELAGHIAFSITQLDSVVTLPRGFTISSKDKFRNQQVRVTVEVPLGRNVQVSKDVNEYYWFTMDTDHRGLHYRRHWRNGRSYGSGKQYIMTATGLRKRHDTTGINSSNDNEEDDSEDDND